MDHGDMDHGDMDHGSMSPDGIPLAEGAEDRDGLEMDAIHLPLGPVLRHWPAGVVLRLTLHGDVVADAEVTRLDARRTAARRRRAHPRRPAPRRSRVGAGTGGLAGRGRDRPQAPRPVPRPEPVQPEELERLSTRLRKRLRATGCCAGRSVAWPSPAPVTWTTVSRC